ncbi:MAG: zinc-binding alcohol dehydrogenase family protein [bacterium]
MKTLVCSSPGNFQYINSEMPSFQPGYSIIQIKRVGICGTDLHAFDGTQPYFSYPRILGHELAAVYVDGDASGFEAGELLTIIPYFNCGTCVACRNNKPNCCTSIKVCGVHIDGGMTEYLLVPSSSLIKSEGLSIDQLALIEPLAIGAHAISRAEVQSNDTVLVVGAGPIGIGIVEFARLRGAKVILMDTNDDRLNFCHSYLKDIHIVNPKSVDPVEALMKLTNGDMPSVVLDATGNLKAINGSFAYMAHGARYVLVGLQTGEITFSHPEFHKREATLMSSRNATRADFDLVIQSIKEGKVNPLNMITHRLSFDEVAERFASLTDPVQKTIKAVIEL